MNSRQAATAATFRSGLSDGTGRSEVPMISWSNASSNFSGKKWKDCPGCGSHGAVQLVEHYPNYRQRWISVLNRPVLSCVEVPAAALLRCADCGFEDLISL